ncbi:hypothetical protein WKI71_43465 [Streptomyces sp. MS1.AVA.1]|uniref:Uncharacterized protein n=1 Tax=Streptomyces machairae TaxID=3134109 RepID=A0ABU8UVV2_9ACTN
MIAHTKPRRLWGTVLAMGLLFAVVPATADAYETTASSKTDARQDNPAPAKPEWKPLKGGGSIMPASN